MASASALIAPAMASAVASTWAELYFWLSAAVRVSWSRVAMRQSHVQQSTHANLAHRPVMPTARAYLGDPA
eukprot:CAMPEP_0183380770 /NCGR_PEP_ID=MMETSP0164_2-20130417/126101_1 /TAXON_ID=221442 /ORGANISM="Coccolithus pelagicus ssp braarudi, Strain PLY182g" /LENGTH=70 /DNA_ID=CAMNT_0025558371 /DNA_START=1604 /DNA_END=1816 /DNA_ORIENTATION=-